LSVERGVTIIHTHAHTHTHTHTAPHRGARPRDGQAGHCHPSPLLCLAAHIIGAPWVSTPATVTGIWRARRLNTTRGMPGHHTAHPHAPPLRRRGSARGGHPSTPRARAPRCSAAARCNGRPALAARCLAHDIPASSSSSTPSPSGMRWWLTPRPAAPRCVGGWPSRHGEGRRHALLTRCGRRAAPAPLQRPPLRPPTMRCSQPRRPPSRSSWRPRPRAVPAAGAGAADAGNRPPSRRSPQRRRRRRRGAAWAWRPAVTRGAMDVS
jgi:hypothetical protein